MAGNHQFSSNTFIQSGSVAEFKDGISVTGNATINGAVSATSFLDANGNPVTTGGGTTVEFFAGTVAGVDSEPPQSLDHFINITSDNGVEGSTTILAEDNSELSIKAVGSDTFNPNYYNFIKIGNLDEPAQTVQEGANAIYTPASLEERTAGTHRYIIYASDTTQGGETHKVYHTVTLNAFTNEPPVIQPVSPTTFQLQPEHDSNTANVTLHFTNSFDDNQLLNQGNDFISRFTAQRTVPLSGTENTPTTDSYDISLTSEEVSETTPDGTQTIEVIGITPDGLADGTDKMSFTVNLSNYNAIDGSNNNTIANSTNQTDTYSVEIEDQYSGTDSGQYSVIISPPPTATISFPIILFEGQDNDDGFSNTQLSSHTHTLLYTNGSNPPALIETTGLNLRYLSSCVRVKFLATIQEPNGLVVANDHRTAVRVMSSSTDTIEPDGDNTLGFFRIDGNGLEATNFSSTAIDSGYSSLETNNFKTLIGNGIPPGEDEITYYFGATTNSTLLNNLDYVRHGDHHHHEVSPVPSGIISPLTIKKCPDVEIKNIDLEVETEFDKNIVTTGTHTRDLLYGLNQTILTSELNTFFPDNTITNYNSYIEQARIRVRLKCTIVEPFGPAHNQINAVISTDTGHTVSTTINLTEANNSTLNTVTSEYTTSHNHSDSYNNGKELKVSTYTSEFFEIELPAGTHNLEVSFVDDGVLTSKGIGITEDSVNAATIQINSVADTTLTNVVTEIETSGYSNEGTTNSLRTVLYGDNRQTNANSSSFDGHDLVAKYSSHSVSRFRVKGILTEPPGPAVSTLTSQIKEGSNNIGSSITIDPNNPVAEASLSNVNGSTDLFSASLTTVDGLGNRVTEFVTSWLDGGHSLNASTGGTSSYTINSNFTYNFDNNSNYTANSFNDSAAKTDTTLEVFDTPETDIDILLIEIEDTGMSGVAASLNTNNTTIPTTHQRTILFNENLTRLNNDGLPDNATANNSILRTRIQAIITEPVGPLHHATDMSVKFDASTSNFDDRNGPIMSFGTGSSDMAVKTPTYIVGGADDGKLQTTYTSIFNGSAIPSVNNGSGNYNLVLFDSNITHNASNENSFKKGAEGNLYGDNFIKVNEASTLTVSDVELVIDKTHSQILHGNNTTTINATDDSTVNAFVRATIQEPVIGHSTAVVSITGQDADQSVTFTLTTGSTNSPTEDVSSFDKSVSGQITYTSIPKPLQFTADPSTTSDSNDSNNDGNLDITDPETKSFSSLTSQVISINENTNFTGNPSSPQTINITGAPTSTVATSILLNGGGSSTDFSQSVFESSETASFYYVYPPGSTSGYASSTKTLSISSNTTITLPTETDPSITGVTFGDGNLSLRYSDAGVDNSFFNTSNNSKITGNIHQNLTLTEPGNQVREGNISVLATNLLSGNGKDSSTQKLFIIPATADSMSRSDLSDRKDYGNKTFRGGTFKTGLLSIVAGTNYTASGTPVNPTVDGGPITTQQVDYIIKTYNGTNNDYTIQLDTHNSPVYAGNYQTPERAFSRGESGTMYSQINIGYEIPSTTNPISLHNLFNVGQKGGNQSAYPKTEAAFNSTFNFTINKVAPFNNVSQNISAYGEDFPYGFQAFDATINVNEKHQDGYNRVELEHDPVSDTLPRTEMKPFEFYYDDDQKHDDDLAHLSATASISHSMGPNESEPTNSLSGVSYYKTNVEFTASIIGIMDVVGKVYPHAGPIMQTKLVEPLYTNLTIKGDGQTGVGSGNKELNHDVYSTGTSTHRRGLRFSEGDLNWIPTNESSINIHTTVEATDINSSALKIPNKSNGTSFDLEYYYYKRNSDTSFNTKTLIATRTIGRFLNLPTISTELIESTNPNHPPLNSYRYFYDELNRWRPANTGVNNEGVGTTNRSAFATFTENDFGTPTAYSDYWLSSTFADFSSSIKLNSRDDLQQTTDGRLIYPSESYAHVNPSPVSYDGTLPIDRMYSTALQAAGFGGNTLTLLLKIYGNFDESDILGGTGGVDGQNIRVDIKVPGPLTAGFVGSGWSNPLNNAGGSDPTSATTISPDSDLYPSTGAAANGWNSFANVSGITKNQLNTNDPHVQIPINLINREIVDVDGVLLIQIRFKDAIRQTPLKHISRLELSALD